MLSLRSTKWSLTLKHRPRFIVIITTESSWILQLFDVVLYYLSQVSPKLMDKKANASTYFGTVGNKKKKQKQTKQNKTHVGYRIP